MIAVQSAAPIPDPRSIPSNAPEHCPVRAHLSFFFLSLNANLYREPSQNLQASQMPVQVVITKRHVPLVRPSYRTHLYLS